MPVWLIRKTTLAAVERHGALTRPSCEAINKLLWVDANTTGREELASLARQWSIGEGRVDPTLVLGLDLAPQRDGVQQDRIAIDLPVHNQFLQTAWPINTVSAYAHAVKVHTSS